MRRMNLTAVAFFMLATTVSAQTPEVPVSLDVLWCAAGTVPATCTPVQTNPLNFTMASGSCGLGKLPSPAAPIDVAAVVKIRVDNPANPATDCEWNLAPSATIYSVPIGNYFAVAQYRGATLVSARSAASNPFTKPAPIPLPSPVPPVPPAGLRLMPLPG